MCDQKCFIRVFLDLNLEKLFGYLKKKNLQIWGQKGFLGIYLHCNFGKLLSYLKSAFEFVQMQRFVQNKNFKLETEDASFQSLGRHFNKLLSHLKSVPLQYIAQSKETSNLHQKYLIWLFLDCYFLKLFSYFTSSPFGLLKKKLCTETKILKTGNKMSYFRIVRLKFEKYYSHIWN